MVTKTQEEFIGKRFESAQSQLVIQSSDLPLATLAGMVEAKAIDLEPTFQRRERWTKKDQSALIESFLLNVPVPPIYLAEERNGTYTAIDGKQRLNAIANFIYGRLKLTELDNFSEATGISFDELPEEIQNSFKLRPFVRVITLLRQTDPQLKYEVFLRLNRGGEKLLNQEIRNVAFRGPLNDLMFKLSGNAFLRQQLKIKDETSQNWRKMVDVEYVLRFFTLANDFEKFSGDLSVELDNFMKENQHRQGIWLTNLEDAFDRAIGYCEAFWGVNAFHRAENAGWRDQSLASIFDAQMVALSILPDNVLSRVFNRSDDVMTEMHDLFSDPQFLEATRTSTNTPSRVKYRIEMVRAMLAHVGR
ncbi:DUF262 domain-containing protein [Agrobacterium tumefaciens]|uniref:DUF262 domain-containing protein n=1 Tax=Agrobacterium tumefaciens TaxID=358 RepID=UPI001BAB9E46|nr:DUF262 domain-containing protein [Agrobacterium tumefaciens]